MFDIYSYFSDSFTFYNFLCILILSQLLISQCCIHCSLLYCFKMSPAIDCVLNCYESCTVCNIQTKTVCCIVCLDVFATGSESERLMKRQTTFSDCKSPFRLQDNYSMLFDCVFINEWFVFIKCVCGMGG